MRSKEQNIAVQPKIALDDLLTRCTDYDDMSLSMDAGELKALKQHISLLESSASTELLSLRKQIVELKQQKPIGQVISCNGNKTLGWINDAPVGTLLFTAAKSAED